MPTAIPPVNPVNPVQESCRPQDRSAALDAMHAVRTRVPGDRVYRGTADLDDASKALVRWFHAHASDNNLSLEKAGALIDYNESTLSRVFNGTYEGSVTDVVQAIADYKELYEKRQLVKPLSFIETSLSKRIFQVCDAAVEDRRMSVIVGASQIGKTTCLLERQRRKNHGSTIYTRMPTGGVMSYFIDDLCKALRIGTGSPSIDKRRRIFECFDDAMLLIVDEAHQATMYGRNAISPVKTLEWIRELHDARKCGVVLCGTDTFLNDITRGQFAGIFTQIVRRRDHILTLPPVPNQADRNVFSAAYGLPPANGATLHIDPANDLSTTSAALEDSILSNEGLGMWLIMLRDAAKVAARRRIKITWQLVCDVIEGRRDMESRQARSKSPARTLPLKEAA